MVTRQQLRLRFRFQARQVGVLTLVWLFLVGEVTLVTIVGGVLVAWLVTIVFPMPPIHYYGRVRPWGLLKLLAALVRDLATSSWWVAAYALTGRPVKPGIVRVDLRVRSDLYQVNIAQLVSIVPGTIVVDARRRDRILYLHVFDLPDAGSAQEHIDDTYQVERRLVRAIGSDAEIRGLEARSRTRDGAGTGEQEGQP